MKISSSLQSLSMLSSNVRPGADGEGQASQNGTGGSSFKSFIPTVTPGRPASLGLENDLWLSSARQQATEASAALFSEFMEWSDMLPAERIRADMLEKRGLTEDDLAAMPEEEREAVEEDIRRAIEQVLGISDATSTAAADATL